MKGLMKADSMLFKEVTRMRKFIRLDSPWALIVAAFLQVTCFFFEEASANPLKGLGVGVGIGAGFISSGAPGSSQRLGPGTMANISYALSPKYRLAIFASTCGSGEISDEGQVSAGNFGLTFYRDFRAERRLRPYIGLSVGGSVWDYDYFKQTSTTGYPVIYTGSYQTSNATENLFACSFLLGARGFLGSHVSVDLGAGFNTAFKAQVLDVSSGLSLYF
jgi:hypothetical protein